MWDPNASKYATREEYLQAALVQVRAHLAVTAGVQVPLNTSVSCGLAGGRIGSKRIGECWPVAASNDGSSQLFISPELSDPMLVLATLVHEAIHAAIGTEEGHGAEFRRVAIAAGLEGKMTATVAGEALKAKFKGWMELVGEYPHAGLNGSAKKKQTTRMIKCQCKDCGYVARTTISWLNDVGAPICPCNGESMVYDKPAND